VETLIENSREDYASMLNPIIDSFIENGLIKREGDGFEKIASLSREEVARRLIQLKAITFAINYLKNPLTAGLANGLVYALFKILRSVDSYMHHPPKSSRS